MLDLPHDSAPPQPTLLSEYQPPDFLIDNVELSFALGEDDTVVDSRLVVRRNPAGVPGAPLRLDGEELELILVSLDSEPLDPGRYSIEPDGALVIPDVPDAFALDITVRIRPQRNTALS